MFEQSIKRAKRILATEGEVMVAKGAAWAPMGPTGDLRERGLSVGKINEEGSKLVMEINLSMVKDGFDYGSFQHDEILHHAVPEVTRPLKGFQDFATTGRGSFADYRKGYADKGGQFAPYRSRFAEKGIDEHFEETMQAVLDSLDWD